MTWKAAGADSAWRWVAGKCRGKDYHVQTVPKAESEIEK